MITSSKTKAPPPVILTEAATFIGIDYHKKYSVWHAVDAAGCDLGKGRIEHHSPHDFATLVKRWPNPRVVFEATMNWYWLYEVLERSMPAARIMLANPFKTRIIAEAQVKTDKIDARILALLLRAGLVSSVHIPCKETRLRKEVLRQRCFFVRQRTMLRNRIHRLLGAQHDLKLPQCSDLFGKRGMSFLEKLKLPTPAGLLLKQQLEMLKNVQARIKEDEAALAQMMSTTAAQQHVQSIPGMGPILAAVVVTEIDLISRFHSAQKLCGYIGLCPSTSSSGGKTYNGKLMRHCNKWLRWAFVEAAWVAMGCDSYFGDLYQKKRAAGKKANTAILCVARRMARITWQLLTEGREYQNIPPAQTAKPRRAAKPKQTFPSRSNCTLVGC
ncbi:IS110 family RNA-guided transposase [Prosthecobacter vanneervenii]|uniref:Transposase n=1 Tax=Prosthecobacter vanneervenii TaxID=48466 RepID=A0A7W8DN62_9BACT|nr:IS110 family transposase [Prosthecobacter vanneervenii]MBB5035765.1 transposase [Prosthecobacter vanneervenii]